MRKPPEIYAAQLFAKFGVNPSSAQTKFYTEVATMIDMMIADSDVTGTIPAAPPAGALVCGVGPVSGALGVLPGALTLT